jgi:hypothetical protein
MKKYEVCVGFTVSAYIETTVEADSIEQLHEKLDELLAEGGGDEAADVCWDSADDYRVVSVYGEDHKQLEVPAELQGGKNLAEKNGFVVKNSTVHVDSSTGAGNSASGVGENATKEQSQSGYANGAPTTERKGKVLVTVEGGVIQNVEHEPGIEVEVHDYDVEGYDMLALEELRTDADGHQFALRAF